MKKKYEKKGEMTITRKRQTRNVVQEEKKRKEERKTG